MGEFKATSQEHLGQVSKAQLVSQPPQDNQQDDVRWELKTVEGRRGSLIEETLAASTTEDIVTEGGFPGKLGSCERSAVRTIHRLYSVR